MLPGFRTSQLPEPSYAGGVFGALMGCRPTPTRPGGPSHAPVPLRAVSAAGVVPPAAAPAGRRAAVLRPPVRRPRRVVRGGGPPVQRAPRGQGAPAVLGPDRALLPGSEAVAGAARRGRGPP